MNINEIAKIAGVSRATVSRYLNDGYVSEEKRLQIKKVIDETGYKPSAQARQLRSKKTRMIGVILPKINSESVSRMVAGISIVLNQAGYQLLLGNTDNDEKQEIKYMKLFKANQVDGIILIGTILTREHYKVMKEIKLPIVVLGQRSEEYSCVYHDDYNASKELTKCLLAGGKHPAFIGVTERDIAAGQNRYNGFIDAVMEDYGDNLSSPADIEKFKKDNVRTGAFSYNTGYDMTKELMECNPDIDSIFCATDSIAVGSLMYLKEHGINVPKQVQLTGIGDTMMGKVAAVSLTTAHYYYKTSGTEASNMLLSMIENEDDVRREVKMGYKIIKNESTLS